MNQIKQTLILLFFLFLLIKISAANPDAPCNLRSFDKQNPIGTNNKAYFGWHTSDIDSNEIQSAYQIIVASSQANLKAATTYYWKVRSWDKDENVSPYSATATFTTGLLTNNNWATAQWTKRDSKDNDDYSYFRKKTNLPNKTIKKAITYISACHSYELYINRKFAGKGFNNHYPQYSYYING